MCGSQKNHAKVRLFFDIRKFSAKNLPWSPCAFRLHSSLDKDLQHAEAYFSEGEMPVFNLCNTLACYL